MDQLTESEEREYVSSMEAKGVSGLSTITRADFAAS
jgi:hypothetical protein